MSIADLFVALWNIAKAIVSLIWGLFLLFINIPITTLFSLAITIFGIFLGIYCFLVIVAMCAAIVSESNTFNDYKKTIDKLYKTGYKLISKLVVLFFKIIGILVRPIFRLIVRKIVNAFKTIQYNKGVSEELGWRVENPKLHAAAAIIEGLFNIPLERVIR